MVEATPTEPPSRRNSLRTAAGRQLALRASRATGHARCRKSGRDTVWGAMRAVQCRLTSTLV